MSIKTIIVKPEFMNLCFVKSSLASHLTREETASLMAWCDCQNESLWESMSLQEILNVYRATAEYETFESWAQDDWREAYEAWNSAVIDTGNKMKPRD